MPLRLYIDNILDALNGAVVFIFGVYAYRNMYQVDRREEGISNEMTINEMPHYEETPLGKRLIADEVYLFNEFSDEVLFFFIIFFMAMSYKIRNAFRALYEED